MAVRLTHLTEMFVCNSASQQLGGWMDTHLGANEVDVTVRAITNTLLDFVPCDPAKCIIRLTHC